MIDKLKSPWTVMFLIVVLTVCAIIFPYPYLVKPYLLTVVILTLYLIKLVAFDYINLELVYKKAKETATGAGMLVVSFSIVILAILNFISR